MACQLAAVGEKTSLVALVDTANPREMIAVTERMNENRSEVTQRINMEWANFKEHRGQPLRYLKRRTGEVGSRLLSMGESRLIAGANRLGLDPKPSNRLEERLAWEALAELHLRAYEDFSPAPYQGRVRVFRCDYPPIEYQQLDSNLGWTSLVSGDLEGLDIPGHRNAILHHPRIVDFAKALKLELEAALLAEGVVDAAVDSPPEEEQAALHTAPFAG